MLKLKIILITVLALISILFLVPLASAAPAAPTGFTAVNFGGPIRLAWTASTGGVGTVTYTVYRVEADSTTIPTNPPTGAGTYGAYAQTVTFGITGTSYIDTSVTDGTTYYYFITGNDSTGESSPATTVSSATSDYPTAGTAYGLTLTTTTNLIDYETTTVPGASTSTVISYSISNTDQQGRQWIANQILYDIIDNFTDASIYKETQVISSNGGISSGQITWDGRWFNTNQYTKHDGTYTVEVWSKDFAGNEGPKSYQTITVHVVHVNDIIQTFTDFGSTTIAHSLPIDFSYQLTQDAWTTITIYNTNGTVTTADDTLVKRFTYSAPRNSEGQDRNFREYQTWDGTDENIKLVPSGIYRFAIDAFFDHTGATDRDTAEGRGWTFALDKRIVDMNTTGITASSSLASIKYTLSETANVKIKICKSGTTFTTEATTGEAIPAPATNLVKTFTFYQQSSGEQEVTWDGNDEGGVAMDKGIYFVVITATDAEGNKFFNTSGTDNLFRTTVSIDKTASQIATDATAPSVTSVTPANGTILTSSFTEVSAILQDNSGGSGVDLANSTITLTDPSGNNVSGTQSNNGSDTITLTVAAQDVSGTYTIRITPRDLVGNIGSQATYTFSLNTTSEEADFKESVFVYPNPIKGRNATFAYSLTGSATVTIDVFTILGEKVWSKVIYDTGAGDKRVAWRCVNNDGNVLADELYIYRITAEYSNGNTRTATKKLIIAK